MRYRTESDSIGAIKVEKDAYYGVHTMRAINNFSITNKTILPEMIISLAQIKKAAALANHEANALDTNIKNAIIKACDEIIGGKLHDQFIVDPIQGGLALQLT